MKSQKEVILNAEQQEAVNARDGVFMVVASPGAGKTTVLINRHLQMLISGVSSQDMLNLTFTNSAAKEMGSRAGILGADSVFRTFHSYAIEILKKEKQHLNFQLCESVIPVSMEDYQLLFDLCKIYPAINWRTLQEKITSWKCENILPDQAVEETRHNGIEYFYGLAYRDYEIKSRERGFLDFDSLMREVVNLLETNEEVRNRWKKKYISIDECQDTDSTQVRFLELLFNGNLFCVGDMNQGCYEWRSAAPDKLVNFVKKLPGVKTLYLGQNFRSTKNLVSFFREIIPEDNGIASRMVSHNEDGVHPMITRYNDAEEEAEQILKSISDPINSAVIARTNRQLFVFQRMCIVKGIKYKILGKKDYFDQNEIKRLLSLAKDIKDSRPANVVLSDLIREHNLLHLYRHSGKPTESSPIENMNSLVQISAGKGSITQFLDYLRRLTHARKSKKGLLLSTIHQFKGKEIDHAYVIGVKQGLLPHKDGEIAEEKRLWFVACSRAAQTLNISFYDNPSEFLSNYQDRIINFDYDWLSYD